MKKMLIKTLFLTGTVAIAIIGNGLGGMAGIGRWVVPGRTQDIIMMIALGGGSGFFIALFSLILTISDRINPSVVMITALLIAFLANFLFMYQAASGLAAV